MNYTRLSESEAPAMENEISGWLFAVTGFILLFFGALIYYSALRFFGVLVGAIIGLILAAHFLQTNPSTGVATMMFYFLAAIFGAIIGVSLTMVFHHIVFFAAGAIIGLILYKMFASGLISPENFEKLTLDKFIEMINPSTFIEYVVMLVGGAIYNASAHFIIIISMSLLGAYLLALGLNIYILFWILFPVGCVSQWAMTKSHRVRVSRHHAEQL